MKSRHFSAEKLTVFFSAVTHFIIYKEKENGIKSSRIKIGMKTQRDCSAWWVAVILKK